MKVKRFVQTLISCPSPTVWVLAARSAADRIYLGFRPANGNGTAILYSTVSTPATTTGPVLFPSGSSFAQVFEYADRSNPLCQAEAWICGPGVLGATPVLWAFEVFEDDVGNRGMARSALFNGHTEAAAIQGTPRGTLTDAAARVDSLLRRLKGARA